MAKPAWTEIARRRRGEKEGGSAPGCGEVALRKETFDVYWRILSYMHVIYDNIRQYRVFFSCLSLRVDTVAGSAWSGGGVVLQ